MEITSPLIKFQLSLSPTVLTINEVAYNLKVTSNKRECLYVDSLFVGTRPFNYDELIKKSPSLSPLLIAAPILLDIHLLKIIFNFSVGTPCYSIYFVKERN